MKARTKTTRWLLLASLFGLLAAAGLTITRYYAEPTFAKANDTARPPHTVLQQLHAALRAAVGATPLFTAPAHRHWAGYGTYSNTPAHGVIDRAGGTGSSNQTVASAGDPVVGTQPRSHRPVASNTSPAPQPGAGDYAYNGYPTLDCGLPAGCGAAAGGTYVIRQISGTATMPSVHNSGATSDNDGSNPPGDNPASDPPGQGAQPPVASAPELDPATLAGAVTLLLGALAVLRGRRRARASC